ncbi:NCMAP protein, partial [Xiphorhynchus elegans]|nr:NCMAP protein [Xiphorhynchus elegans]
MTTASPPINNTQLSVNVTTKSQEQSLYQSKKRRGLVAFFFLKWALNLSNFKQHMRVRRELQPKPSKAALAPALGQGSPSLCQPPTVTFIPVDIHVHSR